MYKILITGASGLLGSNLAITAVSDFDVYAIYNRHRVSIDGAKFFQADLADKRSLAEIEKIEPHIIIHCAALTNIDYCQEHPDEAYRDNVVASINIATLAKKLDAYLIHISTDNVFDGKKGDYNEDDMPAPINIYGKTKLEAERQVSLIYPDVCILRTSIYGWNKISKFSLAEWALDRLMHKNEVKGFKDIYFSPILVNHLIEALSKLIKQRYVGLIHVAGSQSCSKLDFVRKVAEVFELDSGLIKPVSINGSQLKAPRPKVLSLNVSKAEALLKDRLPNVLEGLREMKRLKEEGYLERLKRD